MIRTSCSRQEIEKLSKQFRILKSVIWIFMDKDLEDAIERLSKSECVEDQVNMEILGIGMIVFIVTIQLQTEIFVSWYMSLFLKIQMMIA